MVVYRGKCTHHLLKRNAEGVWLVNNKVRASDVLHARILEISAESASLCFSSFIDLSAA